MKRFVLLICVFVALIGFVGCNAGDVASYKIIEEKEESESLIKEVSYPVFDGFDVVNERVSVLLADLFASYKDEFDSWAEYDSFNREITPEAVSNPFAYYVKPESVVVNDAYVSVVFSCYVFVGGAHGNTSFVSLTYDVANDKFVSITEASNLSLDVISQRCFEELNKIEEIHMSDDDSWLKDGTTPDVVKDLAFTFDGKVLTVYFEPYLVAPYAAGWHAVSLKM